MPTENEFKYILSLDALELEKIATSSEVISQGYLADDGSVRVRMVLSENIKCRNYLTYKKYCGSRLIEIETEIDYKDFNELYEIATNKLVKSRLSFQGYDGLTVDLLHTVNSLKPYFALAEWEVAEDVTVHPALPDFIGKYLLYTPTQKDSRFTNFKLSSPIWATLALNSLTPWSRNEANS